MDYHKLFLEVMRDVQENYSYLNYKKYSVSHLIEKFSNKFKEVDDDISFANLLAEIFWMFKDPHLWVINKKTNVSYKIRKLIPKKNFNYRLIFRKYLSENDVLIRNNAGVVGYYGDVLYVNFLTWSNSLRSEIELLLKMIELEILNNNPRKVIVDVRENHGGDDRLSQILLSYFIPKNSKIFVVGNKYRKSKVNPSRIGKEKKVYQENKTLAYSDAKVCVLIGNTCMSSNEYMILGFQELKNKNKFLHEKVFLIGDKTYGSSGNPKRFEYENRFIVGIPSWIRFFPNGDLFEGKGVSPDIHINSNKSIVEDRDIVFEKAIEVLGE